MPQVSTGAKPEKGLHPSVLTGIALMNDSAAQILFAELDLHNFYKWYATPWEILRQLPGVAACLKEDLTIEQLERVAGNQSDTGAASRMQQARARLFARFTRRKTA
jgi:hypothetical protein